MGARAENLAADLERVRALAAAVGPVAIAGEAVLPVLPALTPLLPAGLRRGSTVAVAPTAGGRTLALAVAAGPSSAGSWAAAVGVRTLGAVAAAGLGIDLARFALVPDVPREQWTTVVGALVDAVDVILVAPPRGVRPADARKLVNRARERGAVLLVVDRADRWPEAPDVTLSVRAVTWEGVGDGFGHLRGRRAEVVATGRRAAARERRTVLWLPGPDGCVSSYARAPARIEARSTA